MEAGYAEAGSEYVGRFATIDGHNRVQYNMPQDKPTTLSRSAPARWISAPGSVGRVGANMGTGLTSLFFLQINANQCLCTTLIAILGDSSGFY